MTAYITHGRPRRPAAPPPWLPPSLSWNRRKRRRRRRRRRRETRDMLVISRIQCRSNRIAPSGPSGMATRWSRARGMAWHVPTTNSTLPSRYLWNAARLTSCASRFTIVSQRLNVSSSVVRPSVRASGRGEPIKMTKRGEKEERKEGQWRWQWRV